MRRVATPPPGVAGGAAAADVCGRAKGVGVAASQQGRDALCLSGKVALLEGIVCIVAFVSFAFFIHSFGPSF